MEAKTAAAADVAASATAKAAKAAGKDSVWAIAPVASGVADGSVR